MTWVVLTGMPLRVANSMTAAAALSAANPWTGLMVIILTPKVRITRDPPKYVPMAMTLADRRITQRGTSMVSKLEALLTTSAKVIIPMVFCASLEPWLNAIAAAVRICSLLNIVVTIAGLAWRKTQYMASIMTKPKVNPSRGEKASPITIFSMPEPTRTLGPPWAIPAPATPAIRLWLPLTGSPKRLAKNTHAAAAATPPATTTKVTSSGETTPLPTALATAVPDIAPRKFIAPAMSTAWSGDITRVETTVAMALAASLNPLAKSKARARKITAMRKNKEVESII